jgi:hypothetical protein
MVNALQDQDSMVDFTHKWFIFGGNYRGAYCSGENSTQSPINFIKNDSLYD